MASVSKRDIAKRARQEWRQQKLQRHLARNRASGFNGMAPPGFDAGAIVDPLDGTLNKDVIAAGQGLAVHIPLWPNHAEAPGQFEVLDLEWAAGTQPDEGDYVLVESHTFEGPIDPTAFPFTLRIPANLLRPDGHYTLRYRVITWNQVPAVCAPVPLICDSVAPASGGPPPAPGVPAEPVTDAYLAAHPQGVEWTVPAYQGAQVGDEIRYWWLDTLPEDPSTLPFQSTQVTAVPMTVHVPPDLVRLTGDGGCYLMYQLRDKATNASSVGHVRLAVALGTLPANLQPPQVTGADDGLVTLEDASAGVAVLIPAFDHWKPSDRIEVTWGSTVLAEVPLSQVPHFPKAVPVPASVLRDTYGTSAGVMLTPVRYRILRGDVPFGPEAISVGVDFSHVGPELPDWPDLVNPQLGAPRVFGTVSNQLNVLTREDAGLSAVVLFDLYAPLNAGEQVEFYWDGTAVPEATYTVGVDDVPGTEAQVEIPWAAIAEAGNDPELPVHYRIRAPGAPNAQRSPPASVNADAFTLVPPAPAYQGLQNDLLNCTSLADEDDAVLVDIPDLSEWLQAGDAVTVTWTPLGGPLLDEVITDAIKEDVIILGAPDAQVTGFTWRIKPYETHILPIYHYNPSGDSWGKGRVQYAFTLDGERIHSAREEKMVAMFLGDEPCNV